MQLQRKISHQFKKQLSLSNDTQFIPFLQAVLVKHSLTSRPWLLVLTSFLGTTGFSAKCEGRIAPFVPAISQPGRDGSLHPSQACSTAAAENMSWTLASSEIAQESLGRGPGLMQCRAAALNLKI